MKQAIFNSYGTTENIMLDDVSIPNVLEGHVLIKIYAASINMLDIRVLTGNPEQVRKVLGDPIPKYNKLGSDFSGVIVELGKGVSSFNVGDEVFGQLSIMQDGSFAQFANVPENQIILKPKEISHEIASTVPMAGVTALQGLQLLDIKKGSSILLYGASGGVGTFMIQIAKTMGAIVHAVCSTRNIDQALSSGADYVIDYKKQEWFDASNQYDAIVSVNGYNPLQLYVDSLKQNGKLLVIANFQKAKEEATKDETLLRQKGIELLSIYAKINAADYKVLAEMLTKEQLRPSIDKIFDLEDIHQAYDHFISGKTLGKTVIKINRQNIFEDTDISE